jgi:diacylglycerol kinase (ATP)
MDADKHRLDVMQSYYHFWIEGNLEGTCNVCNASLAMVSITYGYRCFWCTRQLCSVCYSSQLNKDICDGGTLRKIVLPPTAVNTHGAPDDVSKWSIQLPAGVEPLVVFINKKSGGQLGDWITRRFSHYLNPIQVFDLSKGGPKPALELMHRSGVKPYRVLACGGDGTVAWVLQALDQLKLDYTPPVAVLPLGTGNDLARTLGWGGGYAKEELFPILRDIMNGKEVDLDRWKITISAPDKPEPKVVFMNNYFSVGVDAKIALDWHTAREENPEAFKNPGINLIRYGVFSMGALVKSPGDVTSLMEVEVDGMLLKATDLEGILLLNVPSYARGSDPWGNIKDDKYSTPSYSDGLLEVIGFTSVVNLVRCVFLVVSLVVVLLVLMGIVVFGSAGANPNWCSDRYPTRARKRDQDYIH